MSYEDLVEIADISVSGSMDFDGLAISPNEAFVAFQTSKGSIATNSVESRWIALKLGSRSDPIDMGDAGEPVPVGSWGRPEGVRAPERPIWMSDSRSIVFRARFDGSTQLWKSGFERKQRKQLTSVSGDVESFVLSNDGTRLLFTVTSAWLAKTPKERVEAERGYLYDQRFSPLLSSRPLPIDDRAALWSYDLRGQTQRAANVTEQEEFASRTREPSGERSRRHWVRLAHDQTASVWLEPETAVDDPLLARRVVAETAEQGAPRGYACLSSQCSGHFKGLWISDDGKYVYFLRWEGPHDYGQLALFRWEVGFAEPGLILRTDDFLQACSMRRSILVCVQETATKPDHIVSVRLTDGTRETLYDPNIKFGARQFGEVSALRWQDASGIEGFGHLVKPVNYQEGRKYPLVVVQYRSRGFLRGGVGDEFPIHVLASKGIAVLSFHRPDNWDVLAQSGTDEQREHQLWKDQNDRRRVLSVLQAGISELERTGIVDSTRIGISGVSDGANTASYAMIHAPGRFAAAAVAGTYWNPILYYLSGPALQERVRWFGLGAPDTDAGIGQWRQLSIALNASNIQTPLLIQVSDAELLPETQTASALQREGKAFEMHVFPNEHHIKAEPRHRLNAYRRAVQWFLFWLSGTEEADPVDDSQYLRWRILRTQQLSSNRG